MTTYLTALTTSLIGYALMALAYFGWGILSARLLAIYFEPLKRPFAMMWLGWSISLVFFQLWNFLAPVAISASLIFLAIGFSFAISNLRSYIKSDLGHPTMSDFGYGITVALLSVWIASWSMLTPVNNDSGIYHFNSVRWINEYAVVPGLGNVHSRLAFNQSFFMYVASLNLFPLFNHGHNLANSFLFLLLFAELVRHLFTLIYHLPNAVDHRPSIVAVFFIPLLIYHVLFSSLSSPTPDNASSVLQILLFIHYVHFLKAKAFDEYADSRLVLIAALSATLVTVKLSNLFFAAVIFASSILFRFRGSFATQTYPLRTIIKSLALPGVIAIAWLCRGLITSGYPVYPSTVGHIQTDWSVPIEQVRNTAAWISSWGRQPITQPDLVLGNWNWLGPWLDRLFKNSFYSVVYPICVSALSMILALGFVFRFRRGKKDSVLLWTALLSGPPFAAILFWFFVAPEMRYAHSLFYIAAVASSILLIEITAVMQRNKTALIAGALFLIVNAGLAYRLFTNSGGLINIFTKGGGLINISRVGYVPIPGAELIEKRTASGLKIYAPVHDHGCWDSPLPCTPFLKHELRLRGSDIQSGFTVAPKGEV
jgi:hypothetical protein